MVRLVCLLLALLVTFTAWAQDATPFDPQALAARYRGFDGETPPPPLAPLYKVGDRAQFWVGKTSGANPTRVEATLAAAAANVYLWVEDGLPMPQGTAMMETAAQFGALFDALRQSDNYRQQTVAPDLGAISDPSDLLPIPDVDNDPHLYILYTANLSEDREAIFNPGDSLPTVIAPYSNEHELLYVNTTPYSSTPLTDPVFGSMVTRAIYRWIMSYNAPDQASWLTEALDWVVLFSFQQAQIGGENLGAYLQAPDTPLFQLPTLTTQAQALGGQQLFLGYLVQRYSANIVNDLFLAPGEGSAPLDAALANQGIIDPVTGAPVTARDAFADFVVTNGLNIAFGDGRYVQSVLPLPQGQVAAGTPLDAQTALTDLTVSQFGANYHRYTAPSAGTVSLKFTGNPMTARLPMPAERDPADGYYWSGRVDNANPTLTRSVDLSGVSAAALTFDAWHDLASGWNYGYISVSSDGGANWVALPATTSANDNRYGVAYGAGFTGVSNPDKPRPFPTIGILIAADNVTVSDVVPGGAAEQAGVQQGDIMIGYNSTEWTGTPNVLGLLANYAPGDTLNLYVQRGKEKLDIPVVLGAHPTRIVEPAPLWQAQSVDLTAYAGQTILLRFETVALPGHEDKGFAVDNVAISAGGWTDNVALDAGTLDGWTAAGWSAVDNQVAQRWIVQASTSGTQTTYPRVRQWISPSDNVTEGEWRIVLDAGETLTVVVSGANDDTSERAAFSLEIAVDEASMQ